MRALLTCWVCAALLTLGYVLGLSAGIPSEAVVGVVGAALIGVAAGAVQALRRRPTAACLVFALITVAAGRGLQRGRSDRGFSEVELPPVSASQGRGVLWVHVVGAARPGPRCRLLGGPWVAARCCGSRLPRRSARSRTGTLSRWARGGLSTVTPGPGQPDPRALARARGADLAVQAAVVWRGPSSEATRVGTAYWQRVASIRQGAWTTSRGDEPRSFLAASVLGLPEALRPQSRRALRRAGVGHLIAVSGLHVGVVALLVHGLALRGLTLWGGRRGWAVVAALVTVVAFVVVTGAAAPAVRATVMVGVASVATVLGRPVHGPTALAIAAATMLAARPAWSLDPGFHLSMVAMFASSCVRIEAHWDRLGWSAGPSFRWGCFTSAR